MKCPNCGGIVKEGRFCNYCGTELPDDTKRVEVNINKHIEDVAEIKRAEYEERESRLRQKQEEAKFIKEKVRRISLLVLLGICFIFSVYGLIINPTTGLAAALAAFGVIGGVCLLGYIIYLLITGKW